MKTVKQLKEERALKLKAQQDLVDTANARAEGKRELTDAEGTSFDALQDEIRAFDKQIERAEILEANQKRMAAVAGVQIDEPSAEEKELGKIAKRFSILKALRSGISDNLTGVEKEVNDIAIAEAREAGISLGRQTITIPEAVMRASEQTVGQDAGAYGGAMVASSPQMVASLRPKLVVEDLGATFMTGLQGDVPLNTMADYSFSWLAEAASTTKQKAAVSGPTLTPKRCAATVGISNQLLLQSSDSVEASVIGNLRSAYGFALMTAVINGGGTLDPKGILNVTGVQSAADAAAVFADWARIVELEGLLESENAEGMAYLTHPKLKAKFKTTAKDAGSGLFLADNNGMNGYKLAVTTAAPSLNAGTTYPLIFGDFKELYMGTWGGVSFLSDPYTGASANVVNIHVNAYADAQIANPKAFAINTWLKS